MLVRLLFLFLMSVGATSGPASDPAPGRSPGPPNPATGFTASQTATATSVDNHFYQDRSQCDFDGDLIVIDKEKAAIAVNFTHALFETNVLTHGLIYQVSISKKDDDNNLIQGFSLRSLGDGVTKGRFWSSNRNNRDNDGDGCNSVLDKKSMVHGQLDDLQALSYNWTLPFEDVTRSNVTFRLRYKVHSSGSVFQVNYQFAITQSCQLWLKQTEANVTSADIPSLASCDVYFPNHRHRHEHGLVTALTRLNVPCAQGGYVQFLGTANPDGRKTGSASFTQLPRLCGKLEELSETDRNLYFPHLKNHVPYLRVQGSPMFAFHYRLVDYCYNVTFTSRNGSFELDPPSEQLQCTFKISLPYGFQVSLQLDLGDSANQSQPDRPHDSTTLGPVCTGIYLELVDGALSWQRCYAATRRHSTLQIESTGNRVVLKVSVRDPGLDRSAQFRFRYQAKPVQDVVQECSFGWVAVRQFCVTAVENARLSWTEAESECNTRGGHLASIRSEQAQHVIDNLLTNSPGYRDENAYWLGASDKTYEGDFRWSDGLPFSYTNWFPGWPEHDYYNRQPNDDGLSEQDCIELRRLYHLPTSSSRIAKNFMWNDRDCSALNYFLCERLIIDEPVEDGWLPECNRTITLTPEQSRSSVSSPGYPRQYSNNAYCLTDITAPATYRIVLDFEEFVLEKEPFCSYDYLEIIEVSSNNRSVARRLCDDWSAKLKLLRYVSTGSKLQLKFISDYSHHYSGFKARVSMENAMQCADDRLTMFNNSCYLFVSYPEVTWTTAQQICKGMRAQLASILSPDEQRFATANIRRTAEYRTSAVYWLGAKMSEGDVGFEWVDGSLMGYSAWLPGQSPEEQETKHTTQQCLGIQWTSSPTPMLPSGLYWRSKKCSIIGGYICKRHNQISGSQLNFNRTINASEGRITSPNYPGNYYNNLDFFVRIIGAERTRLIVQFSRLDIESQLECLYDYIQLRSVLRDQNDREEISVKWCGSYDTDMERFNFISDSNEVEVNFHSDYSIAGGGFSITWHSVDVSGCPLQTLTAHEGVVTSPNFPHFLLARLDCAITILAPAGKRVWLEFTDQDLYGHQYGSDRKFLDRDDSVLEIHLGGNSPAFQPYQLTRHLNDGAFVSTNERLQIRLRTADHPTGKGFRAIYKTLTAIQEQRIINLTNATSGTLLHLNYPNHAPSNINYLQHLIAPLGHIILLEFYHLKFSETKCFPDEGSVEVYDNYADNNGTFWRLCYDHENYLEFIPLAITSYLNTMHLKQKNGPSGIPLNVSLRVQQDFNYKIKLLRQEENVVESCSPNPCQNKGKCVSNGGKKFCQCVSHFTGLFCALTICELEPCVFGQCHLTSESYRCHCQQGYTGLTCEQKQKPCEGNPCEGRGECIERGESYHCRCHAWWEGPKCERRMLHIPFRPLSERMLHEPFWLGLITVTVVLAIIGLVWCARRHFPEKLEKLLAEESDRNRYPTSLRGSSLRDQLSSLGPSAAAVMVMPSPQPGSGQRSLFGRLGIRKPSILSLTSPHGPISPHVAAGAAAARTFSLDDLLKPPPRRTPSPRKKRNNSTPTKKNAAEKKQILQQLISPNTQQHSRKVNIGELIQLSERKLNDQSLDDSIENLKETHLSETNIASTVQVTLSDPKLEKKVTFARLLNRVSAEMSSGSEIELRVMNSAKLVRPASTPPSPGVEMRSPNSTSSNQGSDSLSGSDLALPGSSLSRKMGKFQNGRQKPASADSILAMFRNFSSSSAAINMSSSVKVSPSTTPTASTPQDDLVGDDESTTSQISFSPMDSPPSFRKQSNSIEVPVLDALNAYSGTNFLQPPTILLEVPNIITKCLSPIRELPTPLPTPLPSPCITPMLHRSTASSSADDLALDFSDDHISVELPCISGACSDDEEVHGCQDIVIDVQAEDGLIQEEAAAMQQSCQHQLLLNTKYPFVTENTEPLNDNILSSFVIPTLTIQQPSPTHTRLPALGVPGSPPPQREVTFQFGEKQSRGRLLKDLDKPTSLDLPCAPPLITVTCNASEAESDGEALSPAVKNSTHLVAQGNASMCYLSPFSMCSRADRTASESNLSSSGYSSMASPGPSRCGSNNPLCPSEMEDPGHPGSTIPRRPSPLLKINSSLGNKQVDNSTEHCRGRSDSETLSDDPLIESNDEGIGTDHIDEKIEEGELKSAKELKVYIEKDLPKLPSMDRLVPPISKMSLQLPSIVVQAETGTDNPKYTSPMSSRSESPLSDRTLGFNRFSTQFCGTKLKDTLPFTDSDGLYDFPSSDCAPLNKLGAQHRKATGRKREKKSTRTIKSPTKSTSGLHHCQLDVPGNEQYHRVQSPRKPSPKRRARSQQLVTSSSSESLDSTKEKVSVQSSPSPETVRWTSSPTWLDLNTTKIYKRESSEDEDNDNAEESSSIMIPGVLDDFTKQNKKVSRLRTIGHQIRFLRRLEKSLKKRDYSSARCLSDSFDSGDSEEFARVTSPLLQSHASPKVEIRKSNSIGKLQTATTNNPTTNPSKYKKGKTKKGGNSSDLLIPREDVAWTHVLITGSGYSD